MKQGRNFCNKHGLTDAAIDYAVDHNNFLHAFELAKLAGPEKISPEKVAEVYLKQGQMHEDAERYAD